MTGERPDLRRGRIVWARVRDHNGIAKNRPVIILTPTSAITSTEPIAALAVTTTFADPPPPDHVPLPWHPQGRVATKLRRRSAAVLPWVAEVMPDGVLDFLGDVPGRLMTEILRRLEDTS